MTKQIKGLAMAAALLAAGVAHAAVACNNGSITLTLGQDNTICDPGGSGRLGNLAMLTGSATLAFSNGGIGADGLVTATGELPKAIGGWVAVLNIGKVSLKPLDGALITSKEVALYRPWVTDYIFHPRGMVSIDASVSSLVVDGTTGQIESVSAVGGVEQAAEPMQDVLDGGVTAVRNLRFDMVNHAIYADMTGQSINPITGLKNAVEAASNIKLWTFDVLTSTGPTVLPIAGLVAAGGGNLAILQSAGYTAAPVSQDDVWGGQGYVISAHNVLSNLQLTSEGLDFFAKTLGLGGVDPVTGLGGYGYENFKDVNRHPGGWGTITSDMLLTNVPEAFSYVPEPSTYALMGLGLVGISLVGRRRSFQA